MQSRFSQIHEINVDDRSTWENKLFLTLDIDWVHDDILADSIDLIEQSGVATTWFVTHDTPLLNRLRGNPKFELGVHPNFNFLLQSDTRNGRNAEEVVDRLLNIVPEARSVRSHSMTQNSKLMDIFLERGLTHECNHFIPEQSGIELSPWRLWNELIKVPHFWEDDISYIYSQNTSMPSLAQRKGLKVFDFHPIHIFLNTENVNRYESTRPLHHQPNELIKYRSTKLYGARALLKQILKITICE